MRLGRSCRTQRGRPISSRNRKREEPKVRAFGEGRVFDRNTLSTRLKGNVVEAKGTNKRFFKAGAAMTSESTGIGEPAARFSATF